MTVAKGLTEARAALAPLGVGIMHDREWDEYRVFFEVDRFRPAKGAYTNDLDDAVGTGKAMAAARDAAAKAKAERDARLAPRRAAKALNDHHERTAAGFYVFLPGGCIRCFGARVFKGALQVTPDFGDTWQSIDVATTINDHNGQPVRGLPRAERI